jgi:tripartite-type tricarboxylate transporter receptor subunit TctC
MCQINLNRLFLSICFFCLAFELCAQTFPSKPIKLIIPFEAAGTSDTTGRLLAQKLEKVLKSTVIVENKAGANGAIGALAVKNATADGYTLLHTTPAVLINTLANKEIGYDVFKDFTPLTVVGIGTGYVMVINPRLPVKNLTEFIAYAKSKSDGVAFSTPGVGNALHLAAEIFANKVGLKTLHVPFKGTSAALSAVIAGDVDFMIMPPTIAHSYVSSGKVLAVAFSGQNRSPDFPSVPTFKEAGLDDLVIAGTWLGWFAPANLTKPVADMLGSSLKIVLSDPDVQSAMKKDGFSADGRSQQEFDAFLHAEASRISSVLKKISLN